VDRPKPPLASALRAVLPGPPAEHPAVEEIAAYHEGRLAGDAQERLRDHLALCPECTRLLLDLADFAALEPPAGARVPEPAEAWGALRERMGERAAPLPKAPSVVRLPPPAAAPVVPAVVPVRRTRPNPLRWLLAASVVAVLGLGLWVAELRQENARLRVPSGNAQVADLAASDDLTRGGGEAAAKPLPGDRRLLLLLAAPGLPPHAAYEADLLNAPGVVLWTGKDLPRSADDGFTVDLPPGFLRPGTYRLRLYGVDAGQRGKPLAEFPFRIGSL
jgi:Putative zinc-finger